MSGPVTAPASTALAPNCAPISDSAVPAANESPNRPPENNRPLAMPFIAFSHLSLAPGLAPVA